MKRNPFHPKAYLHRFRQSWKRTVTARFSFPRRGFWDGVASILDIGGTLGPEMPMTDEEAFRYDAEMIHRDWETVLGKDYNANP